MFRWVWMVQAGLPALPVGWIGGCGFRSIGVVIFFRIRSYCAYFAFFCVAWLSVFFGVSIGPLRLCEKGQPGRLPVPLQPPCVLLQVFVRCMHMKHNMGRRTPLALVQAHALGITIFSLRRQHWLLCLCVSAVCACARPP